MALVQALVAAVAVTAGLGGPSSGPFELLLLNGLFVALFVVSAELFGRAARLTGLSSRLRGHIRVHRAGTQRDTVRVRRCVWTRACVAPPPRGSAAAMMGSPRRVGGGRAVR